jgi:hypothetical protein
MEEEFREIELIVDTESKVIGINLKDAFYMVKQNKTECHLCGIKGKMLKCSNCLGSYYCSKECQKLHYKEHKSNCKNNPYDPSFKKNVSFNRLLSYHFLVYILKKKHTFLPKKWLKYKFWKIHYIENKKNYVFQVMPHDEIELRKIFALEHYPYLEKDNNYRLVRDDELDSTYVVSIK